MEGKEGGSRKRGRGREQGEGAGVSSNPGRKSRCLSAGGWTTWEPGEERGRRWSVVEGVWEEEMEIGYFGLALWKGVDGRMSLFPHHFAPDLCM